MIVHVPGKLGPNIAVVEVKGHWWIDAEEEKKDKQKLMDYISKQKYPFAYFVKIGKNDPEVERIT